MVKRIGGFRRKTRNKLKKPAGKKGKLSIRNYFRKFDLGEQVLLKAEPSVQKGMYFPRFHSKIGLVKGKRGFCYEIMIKDGGKEKLLLVHPIHLQRVKNVKS